MSPVDRDFLFHNIPTSVKNTRWTIPCHKVLFTSTSIASSLSATKITDSTVSVLCGWMMGFISE